MVDPNHRHTMRLAYLVLFCAAGLLPIGSILLGYWFFHVSLPTLMFISFVLLFVGGVFCYPTRIARDTAATVPNEDVRSEAAILLLLGHASGLGVLIVFAVRLFVQGIRFSWM